MLLLRFMAEHPILTVVLVLILCSAAVLIADCIWSGKGDNQ